MSYWIEFGKFMLCALPVGIVPVVYFLYRYIWRTAVEGADLTDGSPPKDGGEPFAYFTSSIDPFM